jgi:hypothetical protein
MDQKNSKCLVINADYSPLTIISWKKALIWTIKYENYSRVGIEVIDFYKNDYILGVNNKKYPIPAVAKTKRYLNIHNHAVKFSRKNIFIRDDYKCQYCGLKFSINELTYDHVIPKSIWNYEIGTPTCWTNIVTACVVCNRKKRNRTPAQAKMPIQNLPIIPQKNMKYLPFVDQLSTIDRDIPQEWSHYLPSSYF